MADDKVTPHSVALCMLVELYAVDGLGGSTLLTFLVSSVKTLDRRAHSCLGDLYRELCMLDDTSSRVCDALMSKVLVVHASPDSLFDFFNGLKQLTQPVLSSTPHAGYVDRQSMLGQFIRRQVLAFYNLSFQGVARLYQSLGVYKQRHLSGINAQARTTPSRHSAMPDASIDSSSPAVVRSILRETLGSPTSPVSVSLDHSIGGGDGLGLGVALASDPVSDTDLLQTACLAARELEGSVDALHRHYDYGILFPDGVGSGGANGSAVPRAILRLAELHMTFGHHSIALQAILETVRVAQVEGDYATLSEALLFLLAIASEAGDAVLADRLLHRSLERAREVNDPKLISTASLIAAKLATIQPRRRYNRVATGPPTNSTTTHTTSASSAAAGGGGSGGSGRSQSSSSVTDTVATSPLEAFRFLAAAREPSLLTDSMARYQMTETALWDAAGCSTLAELCAHTVVQLNQGSSGSSSGGGGDLGGVGDGGGSFGGLGGGLGGGGGVSGRNESGSFAFLNTSTGGIGGGRAVLGRSGIGGGGGSGGGYTLTAASPDELSAEHSKGENLVAAYARIAKGHARTGNVNAALCTLLRAHAAVSPGLRPFLTRPWVAAGAQTLFNDALYACDRRATLHACHLAALHSHGSERGGWIAAQTRWAAVLTARGDTTGAYTLLRALLALCNAHGLAMHAVAVRLAMADAHITAGAPETALQDVLACLTIARNLSLDLLFATATVRLAQIRLRRAPGRARALVSSVLPVLLENGDRDVLADAYCVLAEAALAATRTPSLSTTVGGGGVPGGASTGSASTSAGQDTASETDTAALSSAAYYLTKAKACHEAANNASSVLGLLRSLALIHHRRGDVAARNAAAAEAKELSRSLDAGQGSHALPLSGVGGGSLWSFAVSPVASLRQAVRA